MDVKKFTAATTALAVTLILIIIASRLGWLQPPQGGVQSDVYNPLREAIRTVSPDVPVVTPTYEARADHLVAGWSMSEGMGNVAYDYSGHHFDLSGVDWTQGDDCSNGTCALFKADSRDRVDFTLPALSQYTISGWIKPFQVGGAERQIFGTFEDNIGVTLLDGRLVAFDGNILSSPQTLEPNILYHIAVSYDGIIKRMYLNGAKVAEQAGYRGLRGGPATFGGSIYHAERYYDGTMSDFRIHDISLSDADILNLANGSKTSLSLPVIDPLPAMPFTPAPTRSGSDTADIDISNVRVKEGNRQPLATTVYLTFVADITNTGGTVLIVPNSTRFQAQCLSAACNYQLFGESTQGGFSLQPGERRTIEIMSMNFRDFHLKPGNFVASFLADEDGGVADSNPNNNSSTTTLFLE